jgi:hypothetical protein
MGAGIDDGGLFEQRAFPERALAATHVGGPRA